MTLFPQFRPSGPIPKQGLGIRAPGITGDHVITRVVGQYLNVPVGKDSTVELAREMKQALDWNPIDPSEEPSFDKFWGLLLHAADKYKKEYKKTPVLIIDHVNRLPKTLLEIIQDLAKNSADRGNVTVVFVSSEGWIPLYMIKRSAWSRHDEVIEIGDVSEEEALQYLKRRKLDGQHAAQVFGLVGGRMTHLKAVADKIMVKNMTLEEVRHSMSMDMEGQLNAAGMLYNGRHYKEGAIVIHKLSENGPISYDDYSVLVMGTMIGDELLGKNVFARHHNSGMVNFQSTLMARFCKKKLASGYWGEREEIHFPTRIPFSKL